VQDQGERTRPKPLHQGLRKVGDVLSVVLDTLGARDVHDQGVVVGSAFELKNLLNRGILVGICTQAINGFGGEGDEFSAMECARGVLDIGHAW
jgi:hypothetical protein